MLNYASINTWPNIYVFVEGHIIGNIESSHVSDDTKHQLTESSKKNSEAITCGRCKQRGLYSAFRGETNMFFSSSEHLTNL